MLRISIKVEMGLRTSIFQFITCDINIQNDIKTPAIRIKNAKPFNKINNEVRNGISKLECVIFIDTRKENPKKIKNIISIITLYDH